MNCGRQRSAQIYHPDSAVIVHTNSRAGSLSVGETDFTQLNRKSTLNLMTLIRRELTLARVTVDWNPKHTYVVISHANAYICLGTLLSKGSYEVIARGTWPDSRHLQASWPRAFEYIFACATSLS